MPRKIISDGIIREYVNGKLIKEYEVITNVNEFREKYPEVAIYTSGAYAYIDPDELAKYNPMRYLVKSARKI